ncbi:MAG: peptidyl-prolyl cis-trans isomerase [Candidatus Omnitrophota bacterium]
MLKKLREKKTAKRLWIGLAIIIIPAFVFWGFSGALRGPKEQGNLEFQESFQAVKNLAIMQFGDNFSEIQKYLNLEEQARLRLILINEAKRRKVNVSNKELVQAIQSNPLFQQKGAFNNKIYSELLQYTFRTQPRAFEEQTRQSLMISKLYESATNGVKLSEEEIREEYRKNNEEISIYYLAAFPSDFEKEANPSEENLLNFFAKNSLQFKKPLSFSLNYLSTDSEDKARQLYQSLLKTKDLAKTAAEFELEVKETGLFGQTEAIPGIGWSPDILMLVSKLKKGQISPPVTLDKYYYILQLTERKEPYIPQYSSIQGRVKDAFIQAESKRMALAKLEECLAKITPAADFKKLAKSYGLKTDSTGLFKFGSYIENIGASDSFWKNCAGLKEGEISSIIELPSGFYIIKLKERVPLDEDKFAKEKEVFSRKLLEQKKGEYFNSFVEELKRKAQ